MMERILDVIASEGPLPFDRYMDLCLYDPDEGFFGSGRGGAGKEADFVTSPVVSSSFGMLVGCWALDATPGERATLVEVGAGSGTMLSDLSDMWRDRGPVYAVEKSAGAREVLRDRFSDVDVVADIAEVPGDHEIVLIANELLDNMPAALAVRRGGGWVELVVDADDLGTLVFAEADPRVHVDAWCRRWFPDAQDGTVATVQAAATDWLDGVLSRFTSVSACLIDYGSDAADLATRDAGSILRAFRRHRTDLDFLAAPGTTDLTYDVNIDAVVDVATRNGATVNVRPQWQFLAEQGADRDLANLLEDEHAAARDGRVMDQLRHRSDRLDLEAVMDPSGLGGFKVIVITSRGTA